MPANSSARPVVLLVDDDADLRELAETVLDLAGMSVVTASDGRRALRTLELFQPHVIVTDMMMPGLDGLGLLREYAHRKGPHAPVLAVSAFSSYLDQARALGAAATLMKPYDPRQLTAVVRQLAGGAIPESAAAMPLATEDEDARLRALFELKLDQPASEPGMQRFLDEVANLFGVPVAGISAVTEDRQRLVTHCSMIEHDPGGPRDQSFCTHAVAARAALVVQDARDNPFFRDNPSVTVRGFQFYAGVPLIGSRGEAVGTLCILDYKPHAFTHFDLELLGLLARRVLATLELRDRRQHPDRPESVYGYLHQLDGELDICGKPLFADLVVVEASRGMERGEPSALVVVDIPPDRLEVAVHALRDAVQGGLIGRLDRNRIGTIVRGQRAEQAEELVRRACGEGAVVTGTDLDRYQGGTSGLALLHLEQALDAARA
jgi:CheY-like chemotaxis protein